jgi:hypothetical protein
MRLPLTIFLISLLGLQPSDPGSKRIHSDSMLPFQPKPTLCECLQSPNFSPGRDIPTGCREAAVKKWGHARPTNEQIKKERENCQPKK